MPILYSVLSKLCACGFKNKDVLWTTLVHAAGSPDFMRGHLGSHCSCCSQPNCQWVVPAVYMFPAHAYSSGWRIPQAFLVRSAQSFAHSCTSQATSKRWKLEACLYLCCTNVHVAKDLPENRKRLVHPPAERMFTTCSDEQLMQAKVTCNKRMVIVHIWVSRLVLLSLFFPGEK